MPGIARRLADGLIYHGINRRQEVFHHKDKDYEAFINLTKETRPGYLSLSLIARILFS